VLLSTVGLILCGVGLYPSIPGAGGVIDGCFKKSGGTLRVVDGPVEQCTSNELPVNWNQVGLPGATGAPGAPGAVGPMGSQGAAGLAGIIPAYFIRDDVNLNF